MKISRFEIEGPLLIDLDCWNDSRGFFVERYNEEKFKALNLPTQCIQDNFSRSKPKTLRGLHYQFAQPQSKLVSCFNGTIFDVVVDIRSKSLTYGKHISLTLDGAKPQWLWVPAGFAHGFCVVGETSADVLYKVDHFYSAEGEGGIRWDDSTLDINWPYKDPIISDRDKKLASFSEYSRQCKFS